LLTNGSPIVSVVDDDASIRRSLRNLLTSVGFRVTTFDCAEAFLASPDLAVADCLVADLRMPGMGGLGLLAHLTSTEWCRPTVILTAHADNELRQRCRAMGASAFFEKPFDAEELINAIHLGIGSSRPDGSRSPGSEAPRTRAPRRPVEVACGTLGEHRHICAFFNDSEEERRVLRSFIRDGLAEGDKSIHVVDPEMRDEYIERLAADGMDAHAAMSTGQLEVNTWEETYLSGGCFNQHDTVSRIDEFLKSRPPGAESQTRIVAHMEWALLDKPGVEDLVEYESRVNELLAKYGNPVICAYDVSKFPADLITDILRVHPVAIIGGLLHENPFYIPPDRFLAELKGREPSAHRT